jgi:hypothetical protein
VGIVYGPGGWRHVEELVQKGELSDAVSRGNGVWPWSLGAEPENFPSQIMLDSQADEFNIWMRGTHIAWRP